MDETVNNFPGFFWSDEGFPAHQVIERAFDATIAINRGKRIIYFNNGAEELFGYRSKEILNNPLEILIPGRFNPSHRCGVDEFAAGEELTRPMRRRLTLVTGLHKNGTKIFLEASFAVPENVSDNYPYMVAFMRNVSERQRAEDILKTQEAHYRALVESSSDTLMLLNVDGSRQYVSPSSVHVLGYGPNVLMSAKCTELVHPDDIQKLRDGFAEVIEKQHQSLVLRYRFRQPDGSWRWCEVVLRNLLDEPDVAAVVAKNRDITERIRTEQALTKSEAQLASILRVSPVGVFRTDAQGLCVYVNERWCEIAHLSPEKAMGEGWIEGVHPDDREKIFEEWNSSVAEKRPFYLEYRFGAPDTRVTWVLGQSIPERDSNDQITGHVGTITDITQRRETEKALQESEIKYARLLKELPGMAYRCRNDEDWTAELISDGSLELTGYRASDIIGNTVISLGKLIHPDDRDWLWERCQASLNARIRCQNEYRIITANGEVKWVWDQAQGIYTDSGELVAIEGFISNITERKLAMEQLQLTAKVLANSREAIMITDAQKQIVSVNPAFEEMTGYRSDEVIGIPPSILSSGHHDAEFYKTINDLLLDYGYWSGEIWDRRKNGELYPSWLSITAVRNDDGKTCNYIGIASDISERKKAEDRINFLAHHDVLTGLPNRLLFRERLEQALVHARRQNHIVALLFLDLDNFKIINDSLGHLVGDKLLQEVSRILLECLREMDIIGRQGGDEFILGLKDLKDVHAIGFVVEKILNRLAKPINIDQHVLHTSASIGIAIYPNNGNDFETLLRSADTALYHAKHHGRNTYNFFTEEMNDEAHKRLEIETQLRRAIANDELLLHYQPQIDFKNKKIVSVEALLRWNNPNLGDIAPSLFISIAEECGLIIPIGEWVLNESCRTAKAWQDAGVPPVTVSINLSVLQLQRVDLPELVNKALSSTGLESRYLELEITESMLMHDSEQIIDLLQKLKRLDISIAIDDFGTGYSSLSYLKRFAVNKLKIDQSFVRDLTFDEDDASIVRAVLALGKSFNLVTIAEGIETKEQEEALIQMGCELGQGYFYGMPVPAAEIEQLLRKEVDTQAC